MINRHIEDIIKSKKIADPKYSQQHLVFDSSGNIVDNLGDSVAFSCDAVIIVGTVGSFSTIAGIQIQIEGEGQPIKVLSSFDVSNMFYTNESGYPDNYFVLKGSILIKVSGNIKAKLVLPAAFTGNDASLESASIKLSVVSHSIYS
jgi:hypothetical protein